MDSTNPCPARSRWQALLDGQLPAEESAALTRHLDHCEWCHGVLEELAGGDLPGLGLSGNDQDEPAVPDTVFRRGLDALEEEDGLFEASDEPDLAVSFLTPSPKPGLLGTLGGYEILEVLGRGGMGIVLKAIDPGLHRVVAIKALAPQLATTAAARRRFAREAQAAAAVSHDHVVTIHAVEETNGLPYLVMQYVPGRTLQDRLDRQGPLEVKEILRIGMQAASGLAAAHAQGLVHRDIKPSNILLENGVQRVRISDFGLARAIDDSCLTQNGVVAGTPEYMAPEQARGEALDARADLFSLGSVLYAMCTGRPPFRAANTPAVLRRVEEETPRPVRELNPDIPDWLAAAITRLHAKDPADRFQSAAEVADLLCRHLAQLQQAGPAAPVAEPGPRTLEPRRSGRFGRARIRWALAGGLLLVVLGCLGLAEATGQTQLTRFVATVLRVRTPDGVLVVEVDDPQVKVVVDDDGKEVMITGTGVQEIRLRSGAHQLRAVKDGKVIKDEVVTITRDGKQIVRVTREDTAAAEANLKETVELKKLRDQVDQLLTQNPQLQAERREYLERVRAAIDQLLKEPKQDLRFRMKLEDASGATLRELLAQWHAGLEKVKETPWRTINPDGPPAVFTGHTGAVNSVAFSPDGTLLASAGEDGTVRLWHIGSASETRRFVDHGGQQVTCAVFSPDGKSILSASKDKSICWWEIATGKQRLRLLTGERWCNSVVFLPGGQTFLSGGSDQRLRLWRLGHSGSRDLGRHEADIHQVAVSPDGKLVVSSTASGVLRLFDVESGRQLFRRDIADGSARCVVFSPDGRAILTDEGGVGGDKPWQVNGFALHLVEVPTGKELHRFPGVQSSKINSVAFSPDGRNAASGSDDGKVRFLDVATGAEVMRFEGHSAPVTCVVFSPDGKQVVSASRDGTIQHHWIRVSPSAARPLMQSQRQIRWKILFNTKDTADYLRQLRSMGTVLVIPRGEGKYDLLDRLEPGRTTRPFEEPSLKGRLYWADTDPASVRQLAETLGIKPGPPYVVALFPPNLEAELREKERLALPVPESEIAETHFRCVPHGDSYELRVIHVRKKETVATKLQGFLRWKAGVPVFEVDNEGTDLDHAEDLLRRSVQRTGLKQLELRSAKDIPYAAVVRVTEAARAAGFTDVHLAPPPPEP